MKIVTLTALIALSTAPLAFAQSTATPPNPNNCSPAMPNCAPSGGAGSAKTPGNLGGAGVGETRQDRGTMSTTPQTATDPTNMPGGSLDSETSSPPAALGPVEGGTSPNVAAPTKGNANGEGGGVQNPGVGSGINGSRPSR